MNKVPNVVFTNFRVGDGQGMAISIDQTVRTQFGDEHAFRSSVSIHLGEPFPSAIRPRSTGPVFYSR